MIVRHLIPHTLSRLVRSNHGSTAIEFALIAPALLFVMMGGLEFGRLMWTRSALSYAAEAAARCAAVTPGTCTTAAEIESYAANSIGISSIASSAFTATTASCGHLVTASRAYQFVASGLFPYSPTLTAQACFK